MTLTIDLLPHLDAGDRTTWHADQNERPLSELGLRQARALTDSLAPELGQHTEGTLLELGYDWEQIIPLKEKGAIP